MCENHRLLLWLARTNLRTKTYDIAFWWVFLSMYIINVHFLWNIRQPNVSFLRSDVIHWWTESWMIYLENCATSGKILATPLYHGVILALVYSVLSGSHTYFSGIIVTQSQNKKLQTFYLISKTQCNSPLGASLWFVINLY